MGEIIFFLVFAIPAVLGLAEIIHIIKMWFLSSGVGGKRVLVLVPDNENFTKQILSTYEQFRWHGNKLADKIIILDCLIDDENIEECKRITRKPGLEVCTLSQLSDMVL